MQAPPLSSASLEDLRRQRFERLLQQSRPQPSQPTGLAPQPPGLKPR